MSQMTEEEYREQTLDRIYEELPKMTIKEIFNIYQYIINTSEFELMDKMIYTKIDFRLYDSLKTKYPEEFL